ncbi:MAG: alanine dehydrogenase [Deltaproteobacteria bacterium]|nr:alanine dehydrogenase [Deltaproteobacteria bacterium]MBI2342379.1 alanine dehydrogenase [Deltaproteobacteria bacterium]MBI2974746.1 alanine dehydrogenase [Deltaproteobacteria bacterium]
MIIGVPKEIKESETRVALTPAGVSMLIRNGHTVLIEKGAGLASNFADRVYRDAGATILPQAVRVWKMADMIVKVKEPLASEYKYFRPGLILFTYLHLASVPSLARALCKKQVTALGYETVETSDGKLPLLIPMSEVAGRVATQIGTRLLHRGGGPGKGLLLGGVTGTKKGVVTVIGGGIVGVNAADVAAGLGAEVAILDIKEDRLQRLQERFKEKVHAVLSTPENIATWVKKSDLLVGAVLVAGDKAPKVITKKMLQTMEAGSVIVDVAIDQGGCVETSRPTSHKHPIFIKYGVIHYCVPNMPALTPMTSTEALTSATLPYVAKLASKGVDGAINEDTALAHGLQIRGGRVIHPVIAKLFKSLA